MSDFAKWPKINIRLSKGIIFKYSDSVDRAIEK